MPSYHASPVLPAGCRAASRQVVAGSIAIDGLLVLLPLGIGLMLSSPALLRLLLVLLALGLLTGQLVSHCLYGRAAGGLLLGLLTVDTDAGLPTGTPRSLLALLHLGSAAGATVLSIRNGPDPSRATLDELDGLAAQAPTVETIPPSSQQPAQPRSDRIPTNASLSHESPPALRAVPPQPPSMPPAPLPPSVPPQAPPPPPESAQQPSMETLPRVPVPPRVTRKTLRAREREQERARQELGFMDAGSPTSKKIVG